MSRLHPVPTFGSLPSGLQHDGAISIAIEEGVPVLRASRATQDFIEDLLEKQRSSTLTPDEERELDQYEAVDDYLSLLNRMTRDLATTLPDAEEDRAA